MERCWKTCKERSGMKKWLKPVERLAIQLTLHSVSLAWTHRLLKIPATNAALWYARLLPRVTSLSAMRGFLKMLQFTGHRTYGQIRWSKWPAVGAALLWLRFIRAVLLFEVRSTPSIRQLRFLKFTRNKENN